MAAVFAGIMRFQRYDEIVIDHSTPSSAPDVTPPDGSVRVIHGVRRLTRLAAWLLAAGGLLLAVSFLLFRFVMLPNLDRLRPHVEQALSQVSGMDVRVGRIEGAWQWWVPRFTLRDVRIKPLRQSRAIRLSRLELVPAWKSWLHLEPRLSSLELDDLQLALLRDRDGHVSLNGIRLDGGQPGDNRLADWLLRQDSIALSLKQLSWHDQLLGLPELQLHGLVLKLTDGWIGHHLTVQGQADSRLLPGLSLDAAWRGDGLTQWAQWTGKLQLAAGSGELSLLKRYWPSAPFAGQGRATSRVTAEFADGRITALQGRWQVEDAALALQRRDLPLPRLAGELDYRSNHAGEHALTASHLTLASEFGTLLRDASISARWHEQRGGRLHVSGLSLGALWPVLQQRLPVLRAAPLAALSGELGRTTWQWQGAIDAPHDYRLTTSFHDLQPQLAANLALRGTLSGELSMGRDSGQLTVGGRDLTLDWPAQLGRPLPLRQLETRLDWRHDAAGWRLNLPAMRVTTPDMAAALAGHWQWSAQGAPQGELTVRVPRIGIRHVADYLPQVIGRETLVWLHQALRGGEASAVQARVSGDFGRFPFAGGAGGRFDVDAEIKGGELQFDPAWPAVRQINGHFAMRNDSIRIDAEQANTAGVGLAAVSVRLPELMRGPAHLLIDGQAGGPLPLLLAYTRSSPVDGWLDGFLSGIASDGEAGLKLGLDIPLDQPQHTRVSGDISLRNNQVQLRQLPLPALSNVSGLLHFNERGVSSPGISFAGLGGTGRLQAVQDKTGRMQFTVEGEAAMAPVLAQYVPLLSPLVTGQSPYHASFVIGRALEALQIDMSLQGTTLHAPAPLDKPAAAEWPLALQLRPTFQGWQLHWQQQERAQGEVLMDAHGNLRAIGVGVGTIAALADRQVSIAVKQPQVILLPWLGLVKQMVAALPASPGPARDDADFPLQVQLETPLLQIASYRLKDVSSHLSWPGGVQPLRLRWLSREAEGEVQYLPGETSAVQARLARLRLPLDEQDDDVPAGETAAAALPDSSGMLALDLDVNQLYWEQRLLGQMQGRAKVKGAQWQLDQVSLAMPEGKVLINGAVPRVRSGQARTEVDVLFETHDAGGVLTRMGVPDALLGGRGRLGGHLSWPGRLRDFELAQLGGQLQLDLRDGRFARVDPGVARLLGVLSLQSLSRRIRLDFTDVFSSGFAFDAITGSAAVKQGVFRSSDVLMNGPAAQVTLRGDADLAHNQQDIRVRITPNLSESVSLIAGATLVNPLLGAVALLTQKVLQDPINQVFSFEYQISGSLTDPQVSKVGQSILPRLPSP